MAAEWQIVSPRPGIVVCDEFWLPPPSTFVMALIEHAKHLGDLMEAIPATGSVPANRSPTDTSLQTRVLEPQELIEYLVDRPDAPIHQSSHPATDHSGWNKPVTGGAKFTAYTLVFRLDPVEEYRTLSKDALLC